MPKSALRVVTGLKCLKCGKVYPKDSRHFTGCPECRKKGVSSNLTPETDDTLLTSEMAAQVLSEARNSASSAGIWRFKPLLCVDTPDRPITLGEGTTPLVRLASLGKELGFSNLMLKNEAANPTGSFKDRLACAVVNHGIAHSETLFAWSSSGNAGTSSAAYAARAGKTSVGLMVDEPPPGMLLPALAMGAKILRVQDRDRRQHFMQHMVSLGAYPTTNFASVNAVPVGSNPYGTEGYRTIAYEILLDLGRAPDVVISPTCYGDQVLGIALGFRDLEKFGLIDQVPNIIAAIPPQNAPSCISTGRYITAQTEYAVEISGGLLLDTPGDDHDVLDISRRLCEREGLFLEASSAAALLAPKSLGLPKDSLCVLIGTATGFKDTRPTQKWSTDAPVVDSDQDLLETLERTYGLTLEELLGT